MGCQRPNEQPEVEQLTAGLLRGDLNDESININRREIDEVEEQLVQQYACDGCNCDYGSENSRGTTLNDTQAFGKTWRS